MSKALVKHIDEKIGVKKILPNAEFPQKERTQQVGYDITLVSRTENRAEDDIGEVNSFATGIILSPPEGYYLEIIAKNTLHKHGYSLANGVEIVSPGNKSELIIPLFKFKDTEDINLPFQAVQMILKPAVYAHLSNMKSGNNNRYLESDYGNNNNVYSPDQGKLYFGDMSAYQEQLKYYSQGMPRPQAPVPKSNYIF